MDGSRWIRRLAWWVLIGLIGALLIAPVGLTKDEPPVDPSDVITAEPPEEPTEVPYPWEEASGKETDEGAEFETPFLFDVSSLVLGLVLDCVTGEEIPASLLRTRFLFTEDAAPPYDVCELVKIVVSAPGYRPTEIHDFETMEFGLFFVRVTLLLPVDPSICLSPEGPRSLTATAPAGACIGEVLTTMTSTPIAFAWDASGTFDAFVVFIYDNPCGLYPPPDTPPTPPKTPGGPTTPGPGDSTKPPSDGDSTSKPGDADQGAVQPVGQPQTTTAGVWEPLWDKLCEEQKEEMTRRHLEEKLSGWAWVKAAREMLEDKGQPVPAEGTVSEAEGVRLPDTDLLHTVGPLSGKTESIEVCVREFLEPGQAFIWQVMGVYTDDAGKAAAMLSETQCVRYRPFSDDTGDLVGILPCLTCAPVEAVWDCPPPIKVDRPLNAYPKKATMNPDERIAISIHAVDTDVLLWKCVCIEETLQKIGSYADRVQYAWRLDGVGRLVETHENSAIYELPVDVAPGTTETATIWVTLSAPRGGDKAIQGRVIVDITGGQEGCDDYQVRLRIVQPTEEPCPPPLQEYGEDCVASLKYGKADGPISGAIQLYRMAYVDEPILLKATHADTDVLVIKCERTICDLLPEFDYGLPDPLAFTWSDEGAGGVFPLGKTGRGVVYVPPRGRDEVTIKCDVTDRVVRDKDVKEREKQPVAEIVIDLTFCEFDWLPEGGNATALTARIYEMHGGQCTFPGPARQITFDLSGVSEKPGYCVNRGTSRNPDLLFSVAANGAFHLCNDQKKEGAVPFHHRATSKARVTETTVTVASEDYGSYGLLGSSAFGAMPIEPRLDGSTTACRLGPNEVEIPRDDIPAAGGEVGGLQPGGNHIADVWDMRYPTHLHESADADTSVNNLYHGDGLERYEEYRGVDTNNDAIISYNANRTDQQELRSPQNERLSPNLKDLFVTTRRTADLPRLSYGRAYENARIVVHRFSGADRRKIDVIEIDISAGVPPTAAYTTPAPANQRTDQDGHLNKLLTPVQTMSWTTDWMGGSNTGSATTYGRPLIFNRSIDGYFDDRPYVDANGNAWHDWPDRPGVEDDNDNGVLDAGEDDNNNGALDGDHLSIPLPGQVPFRSLAWGTAANRRNPYDADGNGQIWVDREYTKAEVTTHVTTHEMGHALGIGPPHTNQVNLLRFLTGSSLVAYNGQGHCDDARCVMYWRVNNWRRQDFLCSDCQSLLRVHND